MNRIKSFWVKILTVAFTLGVISVAPGVACSITCGSKTYECNGSCTYNDDGSISCGVTIYACEPL